MNLTQLQAKYAGRLVKFTGTNGTTNGPVAKVWRVTRYGIWVTMPNGTRQQWHPDNVTVVRA